MTARGRKRRSEFGGKRHRQGLRPVYRGRIHFFRQAVLDVSPEYPPGIVGGCGLLRRKGTVARRLLRHQRIRRTERPLQRIRRERAVIERSVITRESSFEGCLRFRTGKPARAGRDIFEACSNFPVARIAATYRIAQDPGEPVNAHPVAVVNQAHYQRIEQIGKPCRIFPGSRIPLQIRKKAVQIFFSRKFQEIPERTVIISIGNRQRHRSHESFTGIRVHLPRGGKARSTFIEPAGIKRIKKAGVRIVRFGKEAVHECRIRRIISRAVQCRLPEIGQNHAAELFGHPHLEERPRQKPGIAVVFLVNRDPCVHDPVKGRIEIVRKGREEADKIFIEGIGILPGRKACRYFVHPAQLDEQTDTQRFEGADAGIVPGRFPQEKPFHRIKTFQGSAGPRQFLEAQIQQDAGRSRTGLRFPASTPLRSGPFRPRRENRNRAHLKP